MNKKELDNLARKFTDQVEITKPKTNKQVCICMVGLVGSGKSTVVKEVAKQVGAVVVRTDNIRIFMWNLKLSWDEVNVPKIAQFAVKEFLAKGLNVVIDADVVRKEKRDIVKKITKEAGVEVYFIRIVCNIDVQIKRLLNKKYTRQDILKNPVIAIREMWRRTPHHYNWKLEGGGIFKLKKMPFKIFTEVDTTTNQWISRLKKALAKIG